MSSVNSFFRTKLAAKKEKRDPIIDPGEAAEAGLSVAYGMLAQQVLPIAIRYASGQLSSDIKPYQGDPIYNIKKLRTDLGPKEIDFLRNMHAEQGTPFSLKKYEIREALGRGAATLHTNKKGQTGTVPKKQKLLGGLYEVYPLLHQPNPYQTAIAEESIDQLAKVQKSVDSMLDKYKLPEKGVTLSLRSPPLTSIKGPHYIPSTKEIILPEIGKEVILHEVGHAAHMSKPGAGTLNLLRKILSTGANHAVPMALVAGDEMKKLFPGKVDDKVIDFVQQNAPAIIASTYAAAEVYPEIQATTRAVSHVYKTEGASAARSLLKKLIPPLMGSALPIIPAVVGMGLAKKWHKETKEKREELEGMIGKEAGVWGDIKLFSKSLGQHTSNLVSQVGQQTARLLRSPGDEAMKRLYESGKNVVGSREFASGAAIAGIPSAVFAYASYNNPYAKAYTEKKRALGKGSHKSEIEYHQAKQKENLMAPAIIGITAALSGGFLKKLFSDIHRVL